MLVIFFGGEWVAGCYTIVIHLEKVDFLGPMINLWEMAVSHRSWDPGVCFIGGVGTGVTRYLETNSWKKPD